MKLLTQLKSIIDVNKINLDTQIAKCVNCNELFSFKNT